MLLAIPALDFLPFDFGGSPMLAAPLPSSSVAARLMALASANDLILAPVTYSARFSTDTTTSTATFTPSVLEGALIITQIFAPKTYNAQPWDVKITSGTRELTEGRVDGPTAMCAPQDLIRHDLHAPIVVFRGDSFYWEVTSTVEMLLTDGVIVAGYHIHGADGGTLPKGGAGDAFAHAIREEGEWYASGVVSNKNDSVNVSYNFILQELRFSGDRSEGSEVDVRSVDLWLGTQRVTPYAIDWSIFLALPDESKPVVMDHFRWPFAAGDRLVVNLEHQNGAGDKMPVAFVALGRRGPE